MLNRRESLRLIAGTAAAIWAGENAITRLHAEQRSPSRRSALLAPEAEEGPFYISAEQIRRDITEGRPGVPLDLRLAVIDVNSGQAVEGAAVDIWHCDAAGVYSGFTQMHLGPPQGEEHDDDFLGLDDDGPPPDFHAGPPPGRHHGPTDGSSFLRGVQLTGKNGAVSFKTIYPGWYAGREIHIHLKVHLAGSTAKNIYTGGHVCHTGQLFFPDETNAAVSLLPPYALSKTPRTTKQTDQVYLDEQGYKTVMTVRANPGGPASGYHAGIVLTVDPAASPERVGMHG